MSEQTPTLPELGWGHFFQQQLSLEEWEGSFPARVFAVHRGECTVRGASGPVRVALPAQWQSRPAEDLPTVGDWLLLDAATGLPVSLLERKSLLKRQAAGGRSQVQLVAANVDTLFIVTSCNRDFNPSRLERYLALAMESGVEPVVVLTKADIFSDVPALRREAESLRPGLAVEAVNALEAEAVEVLRPWCGTGRTVALVGSSGVGKSTLVNTLCGASIQQTGEIREEDGKGRHTTTARSLHFLPGGGLLLDSPGIRELQLADCEQGVASLFEDIEEIARECRFNDCGHGGEKGCAVQAAADRGEIDPRRLNNYLKLLAEQARTSESMVERRRRERGFGRMVRAAQADRRRRWEED